MAELGNLFGSGEVKDAKIEVEMLDYGYIGECKDWSVVSAILDVLKSGKEGHYPDLIRFAEEKLVELLPPKEKKRYMSLSHSTTPSEIAEAEADLQAWRQSVMAKDAQMKAGDNCGAPFETKIKAPVRGAGRQSTGESKTKPSDSNTVVVECDDADVFAMLNGNQRKRLERLQQDLGVSELSAVKRQYKANLEKTKGNESFRIADNNDAVTCYSNSLAYDARNALVWANRAMAYIRLELFDLAEADSSVALHLDPAYVKAYSRRGLVRFKRGKYAEAVQDFKQALQLDPQNAELQKLLATARDKYLEVEGVPLDSAPAQEEADVVEEHTGGYAGAPPASHARTQQAAAAAAAAVSYVELAAVQSSAELLLPTAGAELVCEGSLQVAVATSSLVEDGGSDGNQAQARFVRVSIVSEDSDSESETEAESNHEGASSFCRVAITEDDDSSDDEERDESAVAKEKELEQERQAEVLKEEGNRLVKAGQLQDAVATYTRCLDLLPTYLPALNNRAQAHISMKSFDLATKDCAAVLAQEPGNPKALYRRAVALHALNDVTGALADLDAILRVDPSNAPAKQLQSQMLQQSAAPQTHKQESLPVPPAKKPAAVVPPPAEPPQFDAQKLKQRAQQLLGDGLNDKVIALLAQYLRAVDEPPFCELLQSDQTSLLHLLATAYSSTEDYQHAVAVQETILRIDPTNFRALYKRAENQLQLATQLKGDGRAAALELAEQDIAAALKVQSNADVLALRQRLLRLRNTAPEPRAPSSSAAASAAVPASAHAAVAASTQPSSSRQQSDAQKELGNTAMAEKHYSTAVMHYTNAIKFDATNLAAVNNRALAYLKLNDFTQAEADATCVVDGKQVDGSAEGMQALRLKALCRRAQARRSLGEQLFSTAKGAKDTIRSAQDKFEVAMQDLLQLLRDDANNKTALVEQKAVKDALKRCSDELAPTATIASKKAAQPSASASAKTPEAKTAPNAGTSTSNAAASSVSSPVPRADPSRVSAMLSPGTAPTPSFGDIGLVARTTKKLRADGREDGTATSSAPSTPVPAGQASDSASKAVGSSSAKKEKAVSSPPPSIVLTTAPTDPPKTVYEFERVWRGLKGRPDLFAQYIACFKKSTFKKVLKDSVSPDLVSFMWTALRDHAPSPEVQLKALAGFSAAPSFALTLSMLPAEDLACVKAIVASLAVHASSISDEARRSILTQSIIDVRATYGFE